LGWRQATAISSLIQGQPGGEVAGLALDLAGPCERAVAAQREHRDAVVCALRRVHRAARRDRDPVVQAVGLIRFPRPGGLARGLRRAVIREVDVTGVRKG